MNSRIDTNVACESRAQQRGLTKQLFGIGITHLTACWRAAAFIA
jgi:hypothetical protein